MSPFSTPNTAGSQLRDTFPPPPLFVPFRIFKDARKDKGQDDFLGNVVVRLKVSAGCLLSSKGLPRLQLNLPGSGQDPSPEAAPGTPRIPSEPHTDVRSLTVPQSFQHTQSLHIPCF